MLEEKHRCDLCTLKLHYASSSDMLIVGCWVPAAVSLHVRSCDTDSDGIEKKGSATNIQLYPTLA